MKILNVVLFLSLLSTLPVSAVRKKIKLTKRREVTRYQSEDLAEEQRQTKRENPKLCTPDMIKASTKIGTAAIRGFIVIITAAIKAIIDK